MIPPTPSSRQPVEPRHAATVILLREQQGEIEVLLTRRHEQMSFMGGMWVFPGGALSPADTSSTAQAVIAEPGQASADRFVDLQGQPLPHALRLGLPMAACRETFEEVGILLARTAGGHEIAGELLARMHERRRAIVSQPERFATFLQEEHLRLALESLLYWSHWITPSVVAKRFDTRFFLARLPPGQTPEIDAVETTALTWMTPRSLIAAARDAAMTLSAPTLLNLMELDASLRQHVSLDAMLEAEARREVVAVLPKLVRGEREVIVMPWDEEYHKLDGSGASLQISYPDRLRTLSSRVFSAR